MKSSGSTTNQEDDINHLLNKQRLEVLAEKFKIPGFSASYVNKDGKISTMEAGVEANQTGEAVPGAYVKENTRFCAASLSKPLFSYLILRLAAANQINLDDTLDTFYKEVDLESDTSISEWVKNKDLKKMTPRMILQHRTGLPIGGPKGSNEFQFEPGTNYGYSGIGILCL